MLTSSFEKLVINFSKAQGNSSELKHAVQVMNEKPKVFISKVKNQSIKDLLALFFNKYLSLRALSPGTLKDLRTLESLIRLIFKSARGKEFEQK